MVEAKSKRRPGVLSQPGRRFSEQKVHLRIVKLLNSALRKFAAHPFAIFLDLNLPSLSGRLFEKPWLDAIKKALDRAAKGHGDLDPHNLIVLSNQPYYYCEGDNPAPFGDILSIIAKKPQISLSHPEVIIAIHDAANKFGNIPNAFEEIW